MTRLWHVDRDYIEGSRVFADQRGHTVGQLRFAADDLWLGEMLGVDNDSEPPAECRLALSLVAITEGGITVVGCG